ncbi:MAG: rhomboid family intramembrane serine protease [Rhodothermales bacterium]|nr:rhomboid family intramembrane serine protease [Rhodothermales bacterium]MBO6781080.1 rhomboid family intramembrane serine protease [Rhodothermales bacterium]
MSGWQRFRLWYASQPVALRTLVAINVVLYLVWQFPLVLIEPVREFVWNHLALNPGVPGILFEPWQLLTYAFLHLQPGLGGLLHVGFNMLWLWWIGRDLEELQGPHVLTAAYVYGALGGSLLTVLLKGAFPGSPLFGAVVHGASGAVLGVMAAVATLYPFKSIGLILIGVVPIRYIVIGLLALDILFLAAGGTSISAHFGGAATGFAYAKLRLMGRDGSGWARVFFGGGLFGGGSRRGARGGSTSGGSTLERMESWLASRGRKKAAGGDGAGVSARIIRMDGSSRDAGSGSGAQGTGDAGGGSARAGRADGGGRAGSGDSNDIDRILDKISERGYDSLTPEEKRKLYEASGN